MGPLYSVPDLRAPQTFSSLHKDGDKWELGWGQETKPKLREESSGAQEPVEGEVSNLGTGVLELEVRLSP